MRVTITIKRRDKSGTYINYPVDIESTLFYNVKVRHRRLYDPF